MESNICEFESEIILSEMFKNKNESNIVYKCTVRLLEDADILECEFQVFVPLNYLHTYV